MDCSRDWLESDEVERWSGWRGREGNGVESCDYICMLVRRFENLADGPLNKRGRGREKVYRNA